ncbi:MAG: Bax inhibitor-1/YccA family protein [Lachnospiraceae bacterium]|nr:Bax inhibitor-1/YccA family protein [Lachnospiraceae bacterium]
MAATATKTSALANPVIRKMQKHASYSGEKCATYGGITAKTLYFLFMTLVGVIGCLATHNILLNSGRQVFHFADAKGLYDLYITMPEVPVILIALVISIVAPLMAWLIRATIPVIGTLYTLSQGIVIGFITVALPADLKWLALLAAILTTALVGVLLFVYAKRIIRLNARVKGIVFTVFGTVVISSLLFVVLNLIPVTRQWMTGINEIINNPIVAVIMSVIFIVIAAFFMLADFDSIEDCVERKVDKKFEWMAAWGLAFTILYVYFKILRLLLILFGNSKNSSSNSNSF